MPGDYSWITLMEKHSSHQASLTLLPPCTYSQMQVTYDMAVPLASSGFLDSFLAIGSNFTLQSANSSQSIDSLIQELHCDSTLRQYRCSACD